MDITADLSSAPFVKGLRMYIVETELIGLQATLAGVVRALDQSLAHHQLSRVELYYSPFSAEPLEPQVAEKSIIRLLRQHEKEAVPVAVRAWAADAQNRQGNHLLRLHASNELAAQRQFQIAPGLPTCFGGLLSRYFSFIDPLPTAPSPPLPSLTYAEGLTFLRRAIGMAVAHGEAEIGSPLRMRHDAKGKPLERTVREVQLVVRQGYLHQALAPLVAGAQEKARKLLKPMLQAKGLVPVADFRVDYQYRPWCVQDGFASAAFPTELDLQVEFLILNREEAPVEAS